MVLTKETSLFKKDAIADDIGEAVVATVSVYMRKNASQTAPSKPTASTYIGTSPTTDGAWEYVMPYPKKNFKFYTCEQYTKVDGTKEYSDVRELSSETYISKWVHDADATYIDGGSLYTNSVTADKIQAGAITIGKLSNDALYNVIYTVSTEHAVSEYPYIKLCTIQTVRAYQNKDVVFSISSRLSRMDTEINWAFNNSSSATASVVSHAYKTGATPVFYASEGNGKYGIYVSKADKYENLQVHDLYNPFPNGITIEWLGTEVTSLPSGYVAFTELAGSRPASDIDDAAETATTYITHIDDNGIRIHPSSTENNSVVINSDGMEVFKGGTTAAYSVAKYGDTARIGKSDSSRFLMNADSLEGYNSSNKRYFQVSASGLKYGTDLANTVETTTGAQDKADAAKSSAEKTATTYISVIDETGITVHPSGTTDDRIQISDGVNVYKDGKLKGEYADTVKLYGGNGTYPLTEINASAVKIAQSGDNYANVDSDGLQVYQGGSEVASFGSEIVLGSQSEYQTRVSPDSFTMSHAQLGDLYSVELGEDETRNIDVSFTVGKGKTKNNLKVAFTSSVTVFYNWKSSGERITLGTYTVSEWAVGSSKTATGLTITRKNSQTFSIKNSGSTTVYVTFRITATAPGLHMHWNGSNNLLWSGGGWYMRTSQTVYLDEPVSSQLNGLVLVWGRFSSGSAINAGWNCQYIPKGLITAMEGNDFDTLLVDGTTIGRKIVKVYDDHITGGSDDNGDSSISGSGMTLHPASFVLRFVYGV